MEMLRSNRREFLAGMLAAGVAPGLVNERRSHAATRSVRLGGPVQGRHDDPEELAREHVKLGYRAAYCPAVSLDDATRIKAISTSFEKHGIVIAEVGRWVNLVDHSSEARERT